MSVTLVASIGAGFGATGGTTSGIDTTGATIIVISVSGGGGTVSFSDSKGNTWTATVPFVTSSMMHVYGYCVNPTVGSGHTFTVSVSGGSSYPAIIVHAFTATGYTFQAYSGAASSFASSPLTSAPSITPSGDGALILTSWASDNSFTPFGHAMSPSGFTFITQPFTGGANYIGISGYYEQPTAAAIAPSWSWTDAGIYNAAMTSLVFAPPSVSADEVRVSHVVMEMLSSAVVPTARVSHVVMELLSSTTVIIPTTTEKVQFFIIH